MIERDKKLKNLENLIEGFGRLNSKIERKRNFLGITRVSAFIIGISTVVISNSIFTDLITIITFLFFLILFIITSVYLSNILDYKNRIEKWIEIKKSYLARLKLDWENISAKDFVDHLELSQMEIDLNLIGKQSLHQLIDFSKSREGSLLLRDLLSNHDLDKKEILKKQNIIKELLGLNKFRDKFLLVSNLATKREVEGERLLDWASKNQNIKSLRKILLFLSGLAIVNVALILLAILNIFPTAWIFTSFVYIAVYNLGNKYYKDLIKGSDFIKDELGKLSRILEYIESFDFGKNINLKKLCEPLYGDKKSPSKQLQKISRIVSILTFRTNAFIWFGFILLYPLDFYLSYKIEILKKSISENFPLWMDVWHKIEAYVSLANFAYLNPEYTFPEIKENGFQFECKEIGHPLIPYKNKVNNDFRFEDNRSILIITGSNMSGKSTFLRTLGINLCLAYSGGPVNASFMKFSPLKLFTCIKISDSVIDGISYFYAEVKRLKELLDKLDEEKKYPLIYLIDEIFRGTNNIERRKGSRAFVKALVERNSVGIISTHDLELVKLSEGSKQIQNFHFKEEIKNDKMSFDYKLRRGPCPTTNALKIMEIEGLPIEN